VIEEGKMMLKGLTVNVYRSPKYNCTNGGVTSMHDTLLLVGEGIEGPDEDRGDRPVVRLVRRNLRGMGIYLHAEPMENKKGKHFMAGGNFIYTSDSRFPCDYPISVHDRQE
jgi:hypothetical protein